MEGRGCSYWRNCTDGWLGSIFWMGRLSSSAGGEQGNRILVTVLKSCWLELKKGPPHSGPFPFRDRRAYLRPRR